MPAAQFQLFDYNIVLLNCDINLKAVYCSAFVWYTVSVKVSISKDVTTGERCVRRFGICYL